MEVQITKKQITLCLARVAAVLVAVGCLVSCRRADSTKVDNGNLLRADCTRLLDEQPLGDIPKTLWPRSIRDLKPTRVVREENDIQIWLVEHAKNGSFGYYVFPNTQLTPPTKGIWIEKTEFKGIFAFKR